MLASKPRRNVKRANSTPEYDLRQSALNRMSTNMMEELLQCKLCSRRMRLPKMLSCQHTFCQSCLQTIVQPASEAVDCPTCGQKVNLRAAGPDGIPLLPTNLYVESLLTSLEQEVAYGVGDQACNMCKTIGSNSVCQHCLQAFCTVCWSHHIAELQSQLPSLLDQLHGAKDSLHHRLEDLKDACKRMQQKISEATEMKIQTLRIQEENLKLQAGELLKSGEFSVETLLEKITEAENTVSKDSFDAISDNRKKVALFLQIHRTTSALLEEVSNWGERRLSFDAGRFIIYTTEENNNGSSPEDYEVVQSKESERSMKQVNSPDDLYNHYRERSFMPRVSIDRSVLHRPAGVGVAPWDDGVHMYIAGKDERKVLVIDRNRMKIVHQLITPDMLYPQGIAFCKHRREVYVTDKWKHCVHVFSAEGTYLRHLGKKGYAEGHFQSPEGITSGPGPDGNDEQTFLYVCDTGNDRVQVIDPHDGSLIQILGIMDQQPGQKYKRTDFNQPTGIAVSKDRVVVSDFGNKRIKTYTLTGKKVGEFGSTGEERGQFRSPECVAVDHLGFILVGDSGNARVQIFRPDGTLLRVFGGRGTNPGKFAWVSGITIANNMDIIVTDSKNSSVQIF